MNINRYRIYCVTESKFIYGFGSSIPTQCYNNVAHTVNSNSPSLISYPIVTNLIVNQQVSSTVNSPMMDFNYEGSNAVNIPNNIYVLISEPSVSSYRIVDITNANNVIATVSNITTTSTPTLYSLTINPSNISTSNSIWELQASATSGTPTINSIQIVYYNN